MPISASPSLPDERLTSGAARLTSRYAGHFAPETVPGLLSDSYVRLAEHARVRTHLVVLTERLTAQHLDALAHTQGLIGSQTRVLFVCSHNAGRSQMAAALLAHQAGEHITVSSAGTHPATEVEPLVVQALTEKGVDVNGDLANAFPKPLAAEFIEAADVVITMGCGDACPCCPAAGTPTGPSPIPRAHRSPSSAPSATPSTPTAPNSSLSSPLSRRHIPTAVATPLGRNHVLRFCRLSPLRLCPQRGPFPDGGGVPAPPRR
ncbi:low molecular weight phosphatase family protein [Streptomyces sp. NPDC008141]|uniref:arsenate-mycothiol transferase ArsC n=1 Tax=Streptomyces sp. NPDC008141 TaxID=3364815 RepID=UPI0036EAB172